MTGLQASLFIMDIVVDSDLLLLVWDKLDKRFVEFPVRHCCTCEKRILKVRVNCETIKYD